MASDEAALGRSLFGYRSASVRQILADREAMFRLAQERLGESEAKIQALQVELEGARAGLTTQAETADARLTLAKAELGSATKALENQARRLASLDALLRQSQEDLAATRQEVERRADSTQELADARAELEATRAELQRRTEEGRVANILSAEPGCQLADSLADLERARTQQAAPVPEAEELTLILEATERGVGRIVERARHANEG